MTIRMAAERKRCRVCLKNLAARDGVTRLGFPTYHTKCSSCRRKSRPHSGTLRNQLKSTCERCGFIPEHRAQLHIDHIVPTAAGGSSRPDNLQTLCANCHALKSQYDRAQLPWPVAHGPGAVLPLFPEVSA